MAEKMYNEPRQVNVGTKASTFISVDESVTVSKDEVSRQGEGSFVEGDQLIQLSSFSVYWDDIDGRYKIYEPKVIDPSGNEVNVSVPAMSAGTFVCEIKCNLTTKAYSAAIKLSDAVVQASDTVTVVKIFKLLNGKVEQYHTGAIILNSAFTGQQGQSSGSNAAKISGNVSMSGSSGSGMVVKSFGNANAKKIEIDLANRSNGDTFGIHDVTSGGVATGIKIFSTDDVPVGGGGGSDSVDVLTGFELSYTNGVLEITWKKTRIKGVDTEVVGDSTETLFSLDSAEVVCDVDYANRNLTQQKQTVMVIHADAPDNPENVFTATAHSQV